MGTLFERLAEGLSPDEQEQLRSVYGTEASSLVYGLEALEPLTAAEEKLFDPKGFISPYLSLQRIYKIRGNLSPVRFNGAVFGLFQNQRPLRCNYCQLPQRAVKVVFKQRRQQPEIIYRNLSQLEPEEMENTSRKLAEAEMRQSFDLGSDPLIRFLVLKTGAKDYAVVVTGLHLAMSHLDMAKLLAEMPDLKPVSWPERYAVKNAEKPAPPAADVASYWQKVLKELPRQPLLPHFVTSPQAYAQHAYRAVMPREAADLLQEQTGGDMEQAVSLLQMAWGLLLQDANETADTYFLLLSDEQAAGNRSSLSMIPVRLKCPEQELVQTACQRLARQVSLSRPFSCHEGQGLEELLGRQHELFNHFLNFHDLLHDSAHFSGEDKESSYERMWDARGLPLGIYFQPSGRRIALTILYNRYCLKETAVRELVDRYFLTLKSMLSQMEQPMSVFKDKLKKRIGAALGKAAEELTAQSLATYIDSLPLFHGLDEAQLLRLTQSAKLRTYFDGDQIIMRHDTGQLFFLLSGRVARHMDPGTGWFSLLDAAREGRLLNETVFLASCRSRTMGEVLSDEARVITLPLPQTVDLLRSSTELESRFFQHILTEMEKYQRRWVNT